MIMSIKCHCMAFWCTVIIACSELNYERIVHLAFSWIGSPGIAVNRFVVLYAGVVS